MTICDNCGAPLDGVTSWKSVIKNQKSVLICHECWLSTRTLDQPQSNTDVWTSTSGAKSSGKLPSYHLVPWGSFAKRLADRYQLGVDKGYEEGNWRKGLSDRAYVMDRANHTLEHLHRAIEALASDTPTNDDDLAAVIWGCIFMMEAQQAMKSQENK